MVERGSVEAEAVMGDGEVTAPLPVVFDVDADLGVLRQPPCDEFGSEELVELLVGGLGCGEHAVARIHHRRDRVYAMVDVEGSPDQVVVGVVARVHRQSRPPGRVHAHEEQRERLLDEAVAAEVCREVRRPDRELGQPRLVLVDRALVRVVGRIELAQSQERRRTADLLVRRLEVVGARPRLDIGQALLGHARRSLEDIGRHSAGWNKRERRDSNPRPPA